MARARRYRAAPDAWPGFVDALSTLLMVIIFMLVVFVLAQFFLGRMLEGQSAAVDKLEGDVLDLNRLLDRERTVAGDLRLDADRLAADLRATGADRDDALAGLSRAEADRDAAVALARRFEDEEARLRRALDAAQARVEAGDARAEELEANAARLEAALDAARQTFAAGKETLEAKLAELANLQQDVASLRTLRRTLEAEVAAQATALTERDTEIADLGGRLDAALADKVTELSQARSEFFGKLRQVLGEREDVRIVGDRFVFQSEVLFNTGEAEIEFGGSGQLAALAQTFKSLVADIPDDLPWVLQVDGHTDRVPINTERFPSNWELSAARAISVTQFLIEQGLPPERLAARAFGSFQPLDEADTPEAYRRNRRIEIKLTTR